MGKGTGVEVERIYQLFPGLKNDKDFRVTSPCDFDYNCIAWTLLKNKTIKWPFPKEYDILDGTEYWPDGLPRNEYPFTFLEMYRISGYELCDDLTLDPQYTKVALYVNDNVVTHAARQTPEGLWTSKLGQMNDIQHSTPYSLEGNIYGKVKYILKKKSTEG